MLNDPDSFENRNPRFIKRLSSILDSTVAPYHRTEVRGFSRNPRQDGLIYIGNHNGYPYMSDFWLFTAAVFNEYGMSRYPYILAHKLTVKLPLLNQLFTRYGCVRATGQNAARVLERKSPLLVYPGAEVELMRPHRERTRLRFHGRTSHIRLAMKYNVPIVPVVSVGSHSTAVILDDLPWLAQAIGAKSKLGIQAWPLMLSIPWGLTLGPFIPPYIPWPSKIIIETLEPMVWAPTTGAESESLIAERAAQVEQAIVNALARLEAERMTLERPPLEVMKAAAVKVLQWVEAHLDNLVRWLVEAGARLLGRSGEGDAKSAASGPAKVDPQVVSDIRHDVRLFREMLGRTERTAVAVPAAVSPRPVAVRAARKPRFTDVQIHEILEQARRGESVHHVCRERGIAASTFYRWRSRYTAGQVESR